MTKINLCEVYSLRLCSISFFFFLLKSRRRTLTLFPSAYALMRPGSCSVDGLHGPASPEENGVFLATGLAVNVSLVVAVSLLTFGIVSLFTMCIPPSYKNNHITILRKNCQRSLR